MSLEYWFVLLGWTFKPTALSLLVIAAPAALLIILLIAFRLKVPKINGAWGALGQRWLTIGLGIFFCALISYFIGAILSERYDRIYSDSLFKSFKKMEKREIKEQIRSLTEGMERNRMADFISDFADKLSGEQRIKFLHAFYTTRMKKSITIAYKDLYWPPEKVEEFRKTHNNNVPLNATNGMEYDEHQKKLFKDGKFAELNKSLKPAQWKFIRNQFILPLERDQLVELLTHLSDMQEEDQADRMLKKLFEENFSEQGEAAQLAWYAESPGSEDTFAFCLEYIRWLRELPELIIWTVIGLAIALTGSRIKRQGSKKIFKV